MIIPVMIESVMTVRPPDPVLMLRDIHACLGFYTRLPVEAALVPRFAAAQWAAPVVGLIIGLFCGIILCLANALALPAGIAAAVTLAFGALLTGALHEDGLADVADGFGGGRTTEDKLAIMKDSRLGSYGGLALVLSVLARWSALVALCAAGPLIAVVGLAAAHGASRAPIPMFMVRLPSARQGGLADRVGRMEVKTAGIALAIGFVILLSGGITFAIVAALAVIGVFVSLERLALKHVGGQTGDVLGALQQGCEIAVLTVAAVLLV
jgi:adenosylcobinamide-GDP ribazoletransferase